MPATAEQVAAERHLRSWVRDLFRTHSRAEIVGWLMQAGVYSEGSGCPADGVNALFDAWQDERSLASQGWVDAYRETLARESAATTRIVISSPLSSTMTDTQYSPTVWGLVGEGASYEFFVLEGVHRQHLGVLFECLERASTHGKSFRATTYVLTRVDWPISRPCSRGRGIPFEFGGRVRSGRTSPRRVPTRAVLRARSASAIDRIYASVGSNVEASQLMLEALVRELNHRRGHRRSHQARTW